MVAILEPFIDTIIICFLTGLVLLSSGVWNEKFHNRFEDADLQILAAYYPSESKEQIKTLKRHISNKESLELFNGDLAITDGKIRENITVLHARSIAEDIMIYLDREPFNGNLKIVDGKPERTAFSGITITGKSLIHSAPLTTEAFNRSFLGSYGQYIVSIGLLLFAFSTAISWSYYGGRAVTYLFGVKYVIWYRIVYVLGFFFASFTDTTIVWNLSYITIAVMTIPNLIGLLVLRKEIRSTIADYWADFHTNWPGAKLPWGEGRGGKRSDE